MPKGLDLESSAWAAVAGVFSLIAIAMMVGLITFAIGF